MSAREHLERSRKRGIGHDPSEGPRAACACWWAARPSTGPGGASLALYPLSGKQFADDALWCRRYLAEPSSAACVARAAAVGDQWPTLHAVLHPDASASGERSATSHANGYPRALARLCLALGAHSARGPARDARSPGSDAESRFAELLAVAARPTAADGPGAGEALAGAALRYSASSALGSGLSKWLGSGGHADGYGGAGLPLPNVVRVDVWALCAAERRAAPFFALVAADPHGFSRRRRHSRRRRSGDAEAGGGDGSGEPVSVDEMVDALVFAVEAHRTQLPLPFRLGAAATARRAGGGSATLRACWEAASLLAQTHPLLGIVHPSNGRDVAAGAAGAVAALAAAEEEEEEEEEEAQTSQLSNLRSSRGTTAAQLAARQERREAALSCQAAAADGR